MYYYEWICVHCGDQDVGGSQVELERICPSCGATDIYLFQYKEE